MARDILHLHIPAFPIALARSSDPSLRGRPVAVAASHSERAPLYHFSGEARCEGLFEGIPLFRARRLCPSLVVIPPDPRRVLAATCALVDLSREYSPLWEPSSTGRLYLDLTGSRRLLGPGRDAALKLEREVARRLGLTGSVGVAGNKLVSRIAAGYLDKPGVCDILRGNEAGFIAPMKAAVLPGMGEARLQVLMADLNLRLVGQIAALTLPQLSLPFGPFAGLLLLRARGIDPSPVLPPRRTAEVSAESFLAEGDNDDTVLLAELYRLAEDCGLQLRRAGKAASKVSLTVTHSDGLSRRRTLVLGGPAHRDVPIFTATERLFGEAAGRRVRIQWMRLVCEGLTEAGVQMDLFPNPGESPREEGLQEALDAVRERYGLSAVTWGRAMLQPNVQRPTSKEHKSKPGTWNSEPGTRSRSWVP